MQSKVNPRRDARGVAVDRRYLMAALQEQPRVASAAGGEVENGPAGRHKWRESDNPGRRCGLFCGHRHVI